MNNLFKALLVVFLLVISLYQVKCDNMPVKFFKITSLSSLSLIDSILVNPNSLELLVNDTSNFRIYKSSLISKNGYLLKLIDYLKINKFNEYFIDRFGGEGFKDSTETISEKMYIEIYSKKNREQVYIFLDIILPEKQWKINDIIIKRSESINNHD
jgi:hypothetical protein